MLWVCQDKASMRYSNVLTQGTSFGAVIEEFEVRDAIYALTQRKFGQYVSEPLFAPEQIPAYA